MIYCLAEASALLEQFPHLCQSVSLPFMILIVPEADPPCFGNSGRDSVIALMSTMRTQGHPQIPESARRLPVALPPPKFPSAGVGDMWRWRVKLEIANMQDTAWMAMLGYTSHPMMNLLNAITWVISAFKSNKD
jgi:hypothetical protein